jgi:hypothetical protein
LFRHLPAQWNYTRSLYWQPATPLMDCGKGAACCHSERSEESLFDFLCKKERFLGTQRASE